MFNEIPLVALNDHHKLHKDVVEDFVALQNAACSAGVSLDVASSYRSIERQLLIWNNKWQGKRPLYDRNGELLNAAQLNDKEKLMAILTWSALPGASRHHWGTDIDVYDAPAVESSGQSLQLIEAEYQTGGPCFALENWLQNNLENFGFYRPYQTYRGGVAAEPWHISHRLQSDKIAAQLNKESLIRLILDLDIEGARVIIEHIDWIWQCFVLNKGQHDS